MSTVAPSSLSLQIGYLGNSTAIASGTSIVQIGTKDQLPNHPTAARLEVAHSRPFAFGLIDAGPQGWLLGALTRDSVAGKILREGDGGFRDVPLLNLSSLSKVANTDIGSKIAEKGFLLLQAGVHRLHFDNQKLEFTLSPPATHLLEAGASIALGTAEADPKNAAEFRLGVRKLYRDIRTAGDRHAPDYERLFHLSDHLIQIAELGINEHPFMAPVEAPSRTRAAVVGELNEDQQRFYDAVASRTEGKAYTKDQAIGLLRQRYDHDTIDQFVQGVNRKLQSKGEKIVAYRELGYRLISETDAPSSTPTEISADVYRAARDERFVANAKTTLGSRIQFLDYVTEKKEIDFPALKAVAKLIKEQAALVLKLQTAAGQPDKKSGKRPTEADEPAAGQVFTAKLADKHNQAFLEMLSRLPDGKTISMERTLKLLPHPERRIDRSYISSRIQDINEQLQRMGDPRRVRGERNKGGYRLKYIAD